MRTQGDCIALVLAAGRARRFGSDKRLARLASGQTLLAATLARALEAFDDVRVVLRPGDDPATLAIDGRVRVLWAEQADQGMGSSLAAGVRALEQSPAPAVAVLLGDMPWVQAPTLKQLKALCNARQIVLPLHHGVRGHPVIFGRQFWPALACLQGDQGGKDIVRGAHDACVQVPVEDAGVIRDVDQPRDIPAGSR